MELLLPFVYGIVSVICLMGYIADHVDDGHDVKITDFCAMLAIALIPGINILMLFWISKGENIVVFKGRRRHE